MLKKYGLFQSVRLLYSLIYTKIFFSEARLIRLPFDIRNRKYIVFGKGFTTGFGCRIEAYPRDNATEAIILFGKGVQINDYVHIAGRKSIKIGNNVLIASKVYISDIVHGNYAGTDNHSHPDEIPSKRALSAKPVLINDNVWIGESVSILPGVTIGRGSIIGANSVVTKNLSDHVIAVGVPAKPIKKFNFDTNRWISI